MSEAICLRKLLEEHGKENYCGCPRCKQEREDAAAEKPIET